MAEMQPGDTLTIAEGLWGMPSERRIVLSTRMSARPLCAVWLAERARERVVVKIAKPLEHKESHAFILALSQGRGPDIPVEDESLWRNGYGGFYDSGLYSPSSEAQGLEMIPEAWAFAEANEELPGEILRWQAEVMRESGQVFPEGVECFRLESGAWCLVYPFLDVPSLGDVLRGSPSDAPQALSQLASTLWTLRGTLGFHQDVKPEHVLIAESGKVALLDPGYRAGGGDSVLGYPTKMFQTTARYYPFFRYSLDDRQALAVILYEWLTGVRPFDGTVWDDFPKTIDDRSVPDGGAFTEGELRRSRMRFLGGLPRCAEKIPGSYWELIKALFSFTITLEDAAKELDRM
jgi:hypothetical protein